MHRQDLLNKLAAYHPVDEADEDCLKRFIRFVENEPDCFERSLKIGHITGAAWLVDASRNKVLLTHHRKLGSWMQLGGHADGNSDTLAVAMQEALEESGIEELRPLSAGIFDLDIHPIPARPGEPEHLHYDVRFAVEVTGSEEYTVSHESFDLAWVDISGIEEYTREESMLRMARKWLRHPEYAAAD